MTRNDPVLVDVCNKLNIPPDWLWMLIQFESRWNPQIRASMPYNQAKVTAGTESPKYARGLIQFIDPTAQDLGYRDSLDLVTRHPDSASQLQGPVYRYLARYAPFPSEQSLYLAVFYPAARNWPVNREFPDSVKAANPGINTPADYVAKVRRIGGGLIDGNTVKLGLVALVVLGGILVKKFFM